MDNLGGKVYTMKAGIREDQLILEQSGLGIQHLPFGYIEALDQPTKTTVWLPRMSFNQVLPLL